MLDRLVQPLHDEIERKDILLREKDLRIEELERELETARHLSDDARKDADSLYAEVLRLRGECRAPQGVGEALFEASRTGDVAAIAQLTKEWSGHVSALNAFPEDSGGQTPLYIAAKTGKADVVAALLATPGLKVNLPETGDAQSPLFVAARCGKKLVCEVLVGHKDIDVNQPNCFGCTPLYAAANNGRTDCLEVLLSSPSIDVNLATKDGYTPLWAAAHYGHTGCVRVLAQRPELDANRAPSMGWAKGRTPLQVAANEEIRGILRAREAACVVA